jgi:D-alanyl-lipoteichoic acid acyltransferase DltB (MBOAT superfamily)
MQYLAGIKLRYVYIFYLVTWLVIDIWNVYQFYADLSSSRSPELVKSSCGSILNSLFLIDLIFGFIGLVISAIISQRQKTNIYFLFTYITYLGLTTLSMTSMPSELIHYEQQHQVWGGGSPYGIIYVFLVVAIGLGVLFINGMIKTIGWLIDRVRKRGDW